MPRRVSSVANLRGHEPISAEWILQESIEALVRRDQRQGTTTAVPVGGHHLFSQLRGCEVMAHAVEDGNGQLISIQRVVERVAAHVVRGFECRCDIDPVTREAEREQRPTDFGAE